MNEMVKWFLVSEYSEYGNGFALKQLCQWQTGALMSEYAYAD